MKTREEIKSNRITYRCRCGKVFSALHQIRWTYDRYGTHFECLDANAMYLRCECGRRLHGKPVEGRTNPAVACSPKCQGAVGPSCECACGGANHGGRWAL